MTVLPGQLPVCCFSPVSELNRVDLPVLGLPDRATTRSKLSIFKPICSRCVNAGQVSHLSVGNSILFVIRYPLVNLIHRKVRRERRVSFLVYIYIYGFLCVLSVLRGEGFSHWG